MSITTINWKIDSIAVIRAKQELEKFLDEAKDLYWMQFPKAVEYHKSRIAELKTFIYENTDIFSIGFTSPQYPDFHFTIGDQHFDCDRNEYYEVTGLHENGDVVYAYAYFRYVPGSDWQLDFLIHDELVKNTTV